MKIISDLIELLKNMELFKNLSKVACIVIISCSIFLFFLKSWFPFNTSILRILWVVSLAIIILYLTERFIIFLKRKYEASRKWKFCEKMINYLSDDEKSFLKEKCNQKKYTFNIDLTDLMHSHLQTLEIISIDSRLNVLHGTKMIAFIEPWVIDLVQKKPKLFETKSISNKGFLE